MKPYILTFVLALCIAGFSPAQEQSIIGLQGKWKFTLGDNKEYAKAGYNDSKWDKIWVPSAWENQGYYGYDGYAWYRTSFVMPERAKYRNLVLRLGNIDDVDEVYFNGKLIGRTGSFPPGYKTAYYADRRYVIPASYVNFGQQNIIAVRVFDAELEGGILRGQIGVFTDDIYPVPDYDMAGLWKFATEDELIAEGKTHLTKRKDNAPINIYRQQSEEVLKPAYDDHSWVELVVPEKWDDQGYENFDGIAYYRKKFTVPEYLRGQKLVLMLGKIDDVDEVYINGQLVGSTGQIPRSSDIADLKNYYELFRGYYLNPGVLNEFGENTIVVKVFDGFKDGGIYAGSVGLIRQDNYVYFWKTHKKKKGFFEMLFE